MPYAEPHRNARERIIASQILKLELRQAQERERARQQRGRGRDSGRIAHR